jgi:rhamnosyltransferase
MQNNLQINQVCGVVVFFHPTNEIVENALKSLEQLNKMVIIINEFLDNEQELLLPLENNNQIFLIKNSTNLGIAAAMNQGIKWATQNDYKWVLTLDQDSTLAPKMVENMTSIYFSILNKEKINFGKNIEEKICGLCPILIDKMTGKIQRKGDNNLEYCINLEPYSSGCLFKTSLFEKIGYFDERLFIYHVDTDFNLRIVQNKMLIFEVESAILHHSEGRLETHQFFLKRITTTNHSNAARYYMARNEIHMLRRYFFSNFKWSINSIDWFIKYNLKAIIFEKNRLAKLKFIFKGIFDGIMNKYGKML